MPYEIALGRLRQVQSSLVVDGALREIVEARDPVLARFQPIFSSERIHSLSAIGMQEFLLYENNKHWVGLHRMGGKLTADMETLRRALSALLDEGRPIARRLDEAYEMVTGLGKAIATAILLVAYPGKYGVWNRVSEKGMKELDIWPSFERGETFGQRYGKVNDILNRLIDDLRVDLWTLDALWWGLTQPEFTDGGTVQTKSETQQSQESRIPQRFGLEQHLHEFMRDNWRSLSLSQEWDIYSEPGDSEAGYKYPAGTWEIDILAKHKTLHRWMVIELKRDQTSDQTVGQVARYMGWVRSNLAEEVDSVEGLIIAGDGDEQLRSALIVVPNIRLMTYHVDFRLEDWQ